jgi:hypothetical protein
MSHTTESDTKKATRRVLASQARTIPSPSPILSANQLTPVAIPATVKQGYNGPLCYVAESRALNPDNAACTFADITWLREQLLLPRLVEQPLDELAMTRAKSRSGMFKVQNFVKKSIWHIFASKRAAWIWHASFWLLFVVPDKLLCCCSLDVRSFTVTCLNLRSFGSHLCFALKSTKLISILYECKLSRSMECKGKPSTRERNTTQKNAATNHHVGHRMGPLLQPWPGKTQSAHSLKAYMRVNLPLLVYEVYERTVTAQVHHVDLFSANNRSGPHRDSHSHKPQALHHHHYMGTKNISAWSHPLMQPPMHALCLGNHACGTNTILRRYPRTTTTEIGATPTLRILSTLQNVVRADYANLCELVVPFSGVHAPASLHLQLLPPLCAICRPYVEVKQTAGSLRLCPRAPSRRTQVACLGGWALGGTN